MKNSYLEIIGIFVLSNNAKYDKKKWEYLFELKEKFNEEYGDYINIILIRTPEDIIRIKVDVISNTFFLNEYF